MKAKLILLFIFYLLTFINARKHHHSSEEEEKEDPTHKAMDRLAVNLAGAFVKSIFPEMDRSVAAPSALPISGSADPIAVSNPVDVRRAPQHTALLQEASGPAFDTLNAFNSRYGGNSPASSVLSAVNSPNYGLQLPSGLGGGGGGASYGPSAASNLPLPTSQLADLIPSIPNALNMAPGGSVEAINALKRQKYLSELQSHQNQLNDYSAKQLEYLDQQRRYQQQMVDHQAGAALLMQQQQQTFLNGMKNKYANFDDAPNKETLEDSQTNAKVLLRAKDPIRQHAVRTAAHEAFAQKTSHEREDFASDEFLKAFFKKNYGIEIPNEGAMKKLTPDERETLKQLKEHLIKEAKENGMKVGAIKTMENFSEKDEGKHLQEGENLEKELASLSEDECGKCIAPHANKLQGSWTQIYGNSKVMRETYSQLLTLMSIKNFDEDLTTTNLTTMHASCVGMEIGKIHRGEAPLNFFFRDDGERRELHEINGNLVVLSNKELKLKLENLDMNLCVVKAGPSDESQFEYVVFAETSGSNKCSSYFVFARNVEDFNDRHYDDIADYMKSQVLNDEALPVAALPKPALCQL